MTRSRTLYYEYKHTNIECLGIDTLPADSVRIRMDSGREGIMDCHFIKKS